MSNTGQIKRYEVYGDSVKDRYLNDDGEYVKYDDHLNIVNDLELRVDDLKRGLDKIFKVVSSFNGGMMPVCYNNVIVLNVEEYNSLVQAINATE